MDKLLKYFFEEPQREFHVRELAKLVKKSPTTVSNKLKSLTKQGILLSEKKLNHLFFKANFDNDIYRDLKTHYNILKIKKSGLIDYLEEEFNYPEAIILFGSMAKASNIPRSDIDILIISFDKKEINLKKFEKRLGHDIQLFINSSEEIEKMKEKNKELLNSFINGIVLYGLWEVFK